MKKTIRKIPPKTLLPLVLPGLVAGAMLARGTSPYEAAALAIYTVVSWLVLRDAPGRSVVRMDQARHPRLLERGDELSVRVERRGGLRRRVPDVGLVDERQRNHLPHHAAEPLAAGRHASAGKAHSPVRPG